MIRGSAVLSMLSALVLGMQSAPAPAVTATEARKLV
jgi:hypothetical protein